MGGTVGGRRIQHSPSSGEETRPGFWRFNGEGLTGGLSVRGEYFFAGWLAGLRVGMDLQSGSPVNHNDVVSNPSPSYRFDAAFAFRVPLARGPLGVKLVLDVGWAMRSWDVFENVDQDTSTVHMLLSSMLAGGVGVRIEPGKIIGIDARFGIGGLLGGDGGVNDGGLDLAVSIRPKGPLMIRAGFSGRFSSLVVGRDAEVVALRDLILAGWVGGGVAF